MHICPNGKKYVGITNNIKQRWSSFGLNYENCTRFYSAIRKYGWTNIEHKILKDKLSQIAKECGYKIILWTSIDAKDWKNPPSEQISNTIINKIQNGDIILLHDYGTKNTVEALDVIIRTLKDEGYKFVTVSELIN